MITVNLLHAERQRTRRLYYWNHREEVLAARRQPQALVRKNELRRTPEGRETNRRALARRKLKDPVQSLLYDARRRAKWRGELCDLEPADLRIPERCPLLGIQIFVAGGKPTDNSPSVDRIDPDRGYVKGNVWVVSWRANRIKNDATLDELRQIVRALEALSCRA